MMQLRLLNGFIVLICIMQATSQYFPSHPPPFQSMSSLDSGYKTSNAQPPPCQRPPREDKQKFVMASGSAAAATEITFDSYNTAFPAQLHPFWLRNIYWLTRGRQQMQQQQQQQQQEQQQRRQQRFQKFVIAEQLKSRGQKLIEKFVQSSSWIEQQQEQQTHSVRKKGHRGNGNKNSYDDDTQDPLSDDATKETTEDDDDEDGEERIRKSEDRFRQSRLFMSTKELTYLLLLLLNDENKLQRSDDEADADDLWLKEWQKPNGTQAENQEADRKDYQKRTSKGFPEGMNTQDLPQQPQLQGDWQPVSQQLESRTVASPKRNTFRQFKRQKSRSEETHFVPSISAGVITRLGHFFKDAGNNVHFIEHRRLGPDEEKLLAGDHPLGMLQEELLRSGDASPTSGAAAFLHAIRTYRPSQKIRSLVSMNPEGYHGSQFINPKYMWVGLGK